MTCNPTSDADYVCSADVPEISKFNLKDANRPKLQQALNNTDWDTVLGGPDEIQNANTNFVQAITNAATLAGVPRFKTKSKNVMDKKIDKLIKEKEVKLSQMLSPTLRNKDKELILQSINDINLEINNLTVTIQEEKENCAIKNIKKQTQVLLQICQLEQIRQLNNWTSQVRYNFPKRTEGNGKYSQQAIRVFFFCAKN